MYVDQGHKVKVCLKASQVSSSSFYYKSTGKRKGKLPSNHTAKVNGDLVSNAEVVEQIRELLSHEFVDYGYIKVTHWLRKRKGYIINKKKVYRLMNKHKLLNSKRIVQRQPRLWVEQLVPQPDGVFEHLEIDIKYIHVQGTRSSVLQLTVLDVKTRYVMGYLQGYSIKKEDVIRLFEKIFELIQMPSSYYVRMDNGTQFTAALVRKFFHEQSGATQEFTLPATPEQNGHIEAFHSIIERTLTRRFYFENAMDLSKTMSRFIRFYNTERIHSGIKYESPIEAVRKYRANFKAVWVAEHFIDKPLLCHKDEGLAMKGSAALQKQDYY